MYLLDTDALFFTSPQSKLSGEEVTAWRLWVRMHQSRIFLSAVTIMEVRYGLERLKARGATSKSAALAKWLLITETIYRGRIVWVSPEIAHRAGEMLAQAEKAGLTPGAEDALIAASAAVSRYLLVARNERHMRAFDIEWENPLRITS